MNIDVIANEISQMNDTEIGGDSALDGFEFQVSSAIYLIFEKMANDIPFALLYEKIEDFIIITDKIELYQSKGINTNITMSCLTQNRSKSKKVKESIIDKMYDNYLEVKNKFSEVPTETTLVTCSTKEFSYNLWNEKKDAPKQLSSLKELCFKDIGSLKKDKIIADTKHDAYDWENIKARRLIPKKYHEETTRIFLEDIITEKLGSNRINSRALYASLILKIKSIRKSKTSLTNEYLLRELNNYLTIDDAKKYNLVVSSLDTEDQQNLIIRRSFDIFKNLYSINGSTVNGDFNLLKKLYENNEYISVNAFYNDILLNEECEDMCLRLNEYEIKALILLVV